MFDKDESFAIYRNPDRGLKPVHPIVWVQAITITSISLALIILAIKGY